MNNRYTNAMLALSISISCALVLPIGCAYFSRLGAAEKACTASDPNILARFEQMLIDEAEQSYIAGVLALVPNAADRMCYLDAIVASIPTPDGGTEDAGVVRAFSARQLGESNESRLLRRANNLRSLNP